MKIIRLGYYKKSRIAYVKANLWEQFFINRKIKKRNSGVVPTSLIGLFPNTIKSQYMVFPRFTKGHILFSDQEKADYYGLPIK